MEYDDPHGAPRHTRGVIGALTLPEAGDDDVLPHERTLPKAKSDRLVAAAGDAGERRSDLGPQPRLRADGTARAADSRSRRASMPTASRHELGAIDDPATHRRDHGASSAASPLVLADGHHRFETACNYRNELRADGATTSAARTRS